MRIGIAAPPMLPIPPRTYAGTERVVGALVEELVARGHEVTLFASGDSSTSARLVPTVPISTWARGRYHPSVAEQLHTVDVVAAGADGLDLVHSHLEAHGLSLGRRLSMPVVTTLHLNPRQPGLARVLSAHRGAPLVAISDSQRRDAPKEHWVATIHHGLPLERMPFQPNPGDYLLLVGRASPDKGVAEAIEIASRSGMQLRIAAKAREADELRCVRDVIRPAERQGVATYLGEVPEEMRDQLFAGAYATLMMGDWPEPFGLVSIESMSAGTPVIARRRGALPEIVRDGVDGFVVEDVEEALARLPDVRALERTGVRRGALERFSVGRMVDQYEAVYAELLLGRPAPTKRRAIAPDRELGSPTPDELPA
jgi:glycosyltransferase involved in cell wall biosynthesis